MIYIIWGIPGGGKSYYGTYIAIKEMMKRKTNKRVFSNYPIQLQISSGIIQKIINIIPIIKIENKKIIFVKKPPLQPIVHSTYIWEDRYIYSGITNAVIILDEAYRDFSSKESYDFKKDKHTFFATNRHNDLDIYIIAQHPDRIEVIIREMCNIFYYIFKWKNPITGKPLWFDISGYLSQEDFKLRNLKTDMRFSHERIWFRKQIAEAYDTKFFRKEPKIEIKRWDEINIPDYFKLKEEIKKEDEIKKEEKKPKKRKGFEF